MYKWTVGCVVLCGVLIAGVSLHAHHSLAGVYALGKEAKVTGAFKAFRLVKPHSSMKLDVKNKDGACVPAADGKSPVGLLSAITYPDGHTVPGLAVMCSSFSVRIGFR